MVAAHRETFGARRRAVGAYSRHADRGRHHRRLCHRLCGVRALRIPATGRGFHPARRRGAADLGRRVAAWTRARRPGRDRRLSGADAGCLRQAGFLVAVCLHRRRQCGRFRAGAVSHVALARHRGGRAGRAVDAAGNAARYRHRAGCPCLPRARRLRAGRHVLGLRLVVRPAGRARRDRPPLDAGARGLSVGRRAPGAGEPARSCRAHRLCRLDRQRPSPSPGAPRRQPAPCRSPRSWPLW